MKSAGRLSVLKNLGLLGLLGTTVFPECANSHRRADPGIGRAVCGQLRCGSAHGVAWKQAG